MNDNADHKEPDATVNSGTIPVIEETVRLETRTVEGANIRILKKVDEVIEDVPLVLRYHSYSIERTSVNQYVDEAPPSIRYEGDTMVISVLQEEAVVVKKLKLVEEIRIIPTQHESVNNDQVTLKKERIVVHKDPPEEKDKI